MNVERGGMDSARAMPLRTALLDPPEGVGAREIEAFLSGSGFAAYQQSLAFAAVAPRSGLQRFSVFTCRDGERLIGAAVVRRTRLAGRYWLATLQRGPIVAEPALLPVVLDALKRTLEPAGCCSVQLAPRVRGRDLPGMADALRAAGFVPLSVERQPLHVATGIVWLDKPEAEILAGFKQRGRRQIRAAEKAGVTVRVAQGAADIAAYQQALDAFRASKPDYDMAGLPDAAGQARLIDALGGAMLLAERAGRVIGGHAFVRQADEAIWLSLATTADDPALPRSYPLLWEAMKRARALGCVGYDLAGTPVDAPDDAGAANRDQFKSAFAPSRRVLPPMHVAALKPIAHALLFTARQAYRARRRRAYGG